MASKILSEEELQKLGAEESIASQLEVLVRSQLESWVLFNRNWSALDDIERKELLVGNDAVSVQCNPLRIGSASSAKSTEKKTDQPCPFCAENLPEERLMLALDDNYGILCHPTPVLPSHFIIAHMEHRPHRAADALGAMLKLSKQLGSDFAIMFDGAACGALTPNHLHFQTCAAAALPLFNALSDSAERERLGKSGSLHIDALQFAGGRAFLMLGAKGEELLVHLHRLLDAVGALTPEGEDFVNIVVRCMASSWEIIVVPRSKYRPSCYFEEGAEALQLSPSAMEMAGLLVAARRSDQNRLDSECVQRIFSEVVLDEKSHASVAAELSSGLVES